MNAICIALAFLLTPATAPTAVGKDDLSRPEWIELAKENTEMIESTPWATAAEARQEVIELAAKRALKFAAEAAPKLNKAWQVPTWLVEDHMLREPIYVEEVEWKFGATLEPMHKAYLLLDLSPPKRDLLLGKWREVLMRRRVTQIGSGLGFVLVCLATLATYLRLDDATKGYYSRWLAAGSVAVVAGSAAALYTWIV